MACAVDSIFTVGHRSLIFPFSFTNLQVVFDLDECVWHPEMYTLDEVPTNDAAHRVEGPLAGGTGVVGVRSGSATIALYPG